MRNTIREFIEPSNTDKRQLWEKAVFIFDTNVLLNLYRYSAKTRNSLLGAFESLKERVWIPYQVAYEFMRRRCEVIYETVQRYTQFEKEIQAFTQKTTDILRLTPTDEEFSELNRFLIKWLNSNKEQNLLVQNATKDEILEKILMIFNERVGSNIDESELKHIIEEGKERYAKSIPPGYRDKKKAKEELEDNNAYGDLIIWKQILKYAKDHQVGIIYVTHDQEEALTMSDTIVVMNQGYIQQMGTPEQIYNEPENAFVADFIGESNIVHGTMIRDELVEIFGSRFACVDKGFGTNTPVDVVIRPEDIDLVSPEEGSLKGVCTHLIFKGVHYEMEVTTSDGFEWLVHSTDMCPVGKEVGIHVDPFDIQIMNKPASEDEEAVGVNE